MCDNNCIGKIAGAGENENERSDLREEVGTKDCVVGRIVQSRIKWSGHNNESREIIGDKETRRLQKTRNTTGISLTPSKEKQEEEQFQNNNGLGRLRIY